MLLKLCHISRCGGWWIQSFADEATGGRLEKTGDSTASFKVLSLWGWRCPNAKFTVCSSVALIHRGSWEMTAQMLHTYFFSKLWLYFHPPSSIVDDLKILLCQKERWGYLTSRASFVPQTSVCSHSSYFKLTLKNPAFSLFRHWPPLLSTPSSCALLYHPTLSPLHFQSLLFNQHLLICVQMITTALL